MALILIGTDPGWHRLPSRLSDQSLTHGITSSYQRITQGKQWEPGGRVVNPVLGERMSQAIRQFVVRGSTVVIVEHNMKFIEETCDEVVVMDLGHVIAQGHYSSLRDDERVVAAYLGSVEDA